MSRKKSLRHIDFERYQEQNAFKKRLQACIVAIAKWKTTLPRYEDNLYKMLRMLKAPVIENIYALSDHGHCFRTKSLRLNLKQRFLNQKYGCLITTITFIILQWWNYQHMLTSSNRMNHMINYLENMVDKGLNAFEVQGSVQKGWRLHVK